MENIPENIKQIMKESQDLDENSTRELLKKYRYTRKPEFKRQIVASYLKQVVRIAKSFYNKYKNPNIELADLIEEGLIGLLEAINRYKFLDNISFKIYSSYWIRNNIQHYVKEKSGIVVQIPTPTLLLIKKWMNEWQKIYKRLGKTPTLKEMSNKLNISYRKAKKIIHLLNSYTKISSLDTPLEDEETTLGDMIVDKSLTPEEILSYISTYETLNEVFGKILTTREAAVLKHRYQQDRGGFKKGLSYRSIAKIFHLSAEYIRKIEKNALLKLKNYLSSKL